MYQTSWPAGDAPPTRTLLPAAHRLTLSHRHMLLWGLQAGLAMFFIGAGYAKLSQPLDLLAYLLDWPTSVSSETVRLAGWLEMGAALAVLSPLISWRLRPVLLAGALAIFIQTGLMAAYHGLEAFQQMAVVHGQIAIVNGFLLLMAGSVFIGRLAPHHRTPRARPPLTAVRTASATASSSRMFVPEAAR